MKKLFWRIWNDDALAERIIRAVFMTVGNLMIAGAIPGGVEIGAAITGLAVLIPAGQSNDAPPIPKS